MPRSLPASLSPHICIVSSPDLTEVLDSASLPPLPYILQSFSPFPQVTTRTTSLASVPHASFALRFSELAEVEAACKEDEEQRAVRTIDWISARIEHRSSKWVEEMEKVANKELLRTPWWDELKRCAEGDHIPHQLETWNHPVAIILAVSTAAPNPLQAITALHARPISLPPWVDQNYLKYTVIVHPENSKLSNEEAGALFNAVKKQFGLHSYLLPLALPSPSPKPVPVPALMPRLPPIPTEETSDYTFQPPQTPMTATPMTPRADGYFPHMPTNTIKMSENDIQSTARFTREFLVMSLIPWMERNVIEWNEIFSSNRRLLPSRLFSSTRRLFASPSPSPAPGASASGPTRSNTMNGPVSTQATPPSQQRRLAEFATILGDLKLAVSVWESLRKEGKGGSDILTLLLSPSPTLQLHASSALMAVNPPIPEPSARSQVLAMHYAVRWEIGIGHPEFLDGSLEGERWLVWAAGNAEEPPSALLLAHAALLSGKKRARRRASLLYFAAANRLEKCGIKPLTMYFLRRAHDMYKLSPPKELSPAFWQAEGKTPSTTEGFDAIMAGIEHPLGRLLYTTGDVTAAVRFFIGLLRGTPAVTPAATPLPMSAGPTPSFDKVFLDDFRVAFAHHKSISRLPNQLADLKLPFSFSVPTQTKLRLAHDISSDASQWQTLEDDWKSFWSASGHRDVLKKGGKATINESFFLDLVLYNPLDVEVNLSNVTLTVVESTPNEDASSDLEVEIVSQVMLGPLETRIVPIAIKSSSPTTLTITHVTFQFLSLLSTTESLATRGRRLQETLAHRETPTYAPDNIVKVEVVEARHKLVVNFVDDDDQRLVLAQGETKPLRMWFTNAGTFPLREVWMVTSSEDEVWVDDESASKGIASSSYQLASDNSIARRTPYNISLGDSGVLEPGSSIEVPVVLHTERLGDQELCVLFVYRESPSDAFHAARAMQNYEVQSILRINVQAEPSVNNDDLFSMDVHLESTYLENTIQLRHLATLSPTWQVSGPTQPDISLHAQQTWRLAFGIRKWQHASAYHPLISYITQRLRTVLLGRSEVPSAPPPLDLCASPLAGDTSFLNSASTKHFIRSRRRDLITQSLIKNHPYIPPDSHATIFPLYHPYSIDLIAFWEIPAEKRSGHLLITGTQVGACHEDLREILAQAETSKASRNMYAETAREKAEVLNAIRHSDWNNEMDPLKLRLVCADTAIHDFNTGPYLVPVAFTLRNHSLTHKVRYLLKLSPGSPSKPSEMLPAAYHGRMTFRGDLEPMGLVTIKSNIWVTRPGTYALGGWSLEDEVFDTDADTVRHRYLQQADMAVRECITISDLPTLDT